MLYVKTQNLVQIGVERFRMLFERLECYYDTIRLSVRLAIVASIAVAKSSAKMS